MEQIELVVKENYEFGNRELTNLIELFQIFGPPKILCKGQNRSC